MRRAVLCVLTIMISVYSVNIKSVSGYASYTHGDDESKSEAEQNAVTKAKRDAVEKFATAISSSTVIEDFEMKKDRIRACSEGMLRNTVFLIKEYDYPTWTIKLNAEIDEDEVLKLLKEKQTFSLINEKIRDQVISGMNAEKNYMIGDALKYYYRAYLLLKCDEADNSLKFDEFDKRMLNTSLPEKINNLFYGLNFSVVSIEKSGKTKKAVIFAKYRGKPVSNLDITYYTGDSWSSSLVRFKDGLGKIDLFGTAAESMEKLSLKVEYKYDNLIKFEEDIKKAVELNGHIPFQDASFRIDLEVREEKADKAEEDKQEASEENFDVQTDPYMDSVQKILDAVRSKEFSSAKEAFSDNGYRIYNDLVMYGNAELLLEDTELKTFKLNDQMIVRSVPMKFSFPRNDTEFTENVVFTFNKEGKIDALTFALSDIAVNDILNKPDKFGTAEEKIQLIQFMEVYKTAYCLEKIDYIESIFADNALIIVGTVLKEGENIGEMYESLSNDKKVKYEKMGKQEYIRRLRKVFKTNEFVNIRFEDNKVEKRNNQKIYALEIKQKYYSANYSDEGYLFLLMDLRDMEKPQIYVRAWQPDSMKTDDRLQLADWKFDF